MSVMTRKGYQIVIEESQQGDFVLKVRHPEGVPLVALDLTLGELMNLEIHLGEVIEAREGEPRFDKLQADSREDLKALLKEAVTEVINEHPRFFTPPPLDFSYILEQFFTPNQYPPKGPDAGV